MSRAPPFPTASRRPQSPASANGIDAYGTNIRPLQINRGPARPTTPSNNSGTSVSSSPSGPSRPQRSELRSRQVSDLSTRPPPTSIRPSRPNRDRRDSAGTTTSDVSLPNPYRSRNESDATISSVRPGQRLRSGTTDTNASGELATSPTLANVMSAFQSVRKKTIDGDDEWEEERRREARAEQERQKRIRAKAPGRRVNGKAKAGDIDAVLDQIKDEWEFVIDPDFNPVDLALQILEESSSGKDLESFRQTKHMLSRALKGSVDKHYQAFAASLPHHASLLSHLGSSQTQIKEARTSLQEAKEALGNRRADLVQMWNRGQTLEEMLRILDQIERLKLVPDVLESLMSEKRLLHAAILLVRSLKTANSQDMMDIGAVADLRGYLIGQETALREILIDELHSHLYLKSFWCDSRWAAYTPNQQSMPNVEFETEPLTSQFESQQPPSPISPTIPTSPSLRPSRLSRYLNDLAIRPNDPPDDFEGSNIRHSMSFGGGGSSLSGSVTNSSNAVPPSATVATFGNLLAAQDDDQGKNPETDSFAYLETLLESLAVLGKLGSALDVVAQRLPNEIFQLIESTIEEVGERAEYARRSSLIITSTTSSAGKMNSVYIMVSGDVTIDLGASSMPRRGNSRHGPAMSALQLRLAALEGSSKHSEHEILRDLFWTLYSKLDAVTQGLRVVYEVSNRIGSRRDFKDSSGAKPGALFNLAEIWMPVQAEVRTLLNDYLTDEEQGAMAGRNPISSINDVLREGRFTRDKAKHVFRFADTDLKLSAKILKPHEEELNRVLRDSVPGLVQGNNDTTVQATLSSVGTDERLLGVDQHHRLLIKPDAFHVSVLFQPTLAFLDRVAAILPAGQESARTSSAVLDDFVAKVYLPQLEDKVSLLFHQAVTGSEAFQPDPASAWLSEQPLINASTQLMSLINSLCAMLRTTPFHRENYARLILTVIIQFYQRCSDRFQALVSPSSSASTDETPKETRVALASQWAQNAELIPTLTELMNIADEDTNGKRKLCKQEGEIERGFLADRSIAKDDLVMPMRNLASLCNLHRSISWFASALAQLKAVAEDATMSPTTPKKLEPMSATTPYSPYMSFMLPMSSPNELQLPLSRDMTLRFHSLLKTYELLAEIVLFTIRVDIRCRIGHYLDLAFRYGNYHPDREVGEPDPHIIDLNIELGECDDIVSTTLPPQDQRFVFEGIGLLMEELLISNAQKIRRANAFGMKKMSRNMLALQQCVKTIARDPSDTEFELAKQYYALFNVNPADMINSIRKKQVFTFDEYKTMLDLQCGVDRTQTKNGAPQATDRNYSMYIIDLHGLELEKS